MMQDTDDMDSHSTNLEPPSYMLYKRRWYILFVLSLLQCSNAMIWISYATIADHTAKFYSTTTDVVNYISLVYMVASAVFGIVSAFILDYMGLRAGIIVGAWLNCIGAAIKFLSSFDNVPDNGALVYIVFVGQSVAALAQPYLMFATTKLAALWFPEEHRALANTIGSMSNPLGIMVGSLLAPAVVDSVQGSQFRVLTGIHLGPAAAAAILSLFVSSRPPTPPSASADEDSIPFVAGVKKMFQSKAYIVLMICCGAGIALFTSLTTVLQQILCPQGYTDSFAGTCSAVMIAVGIVGAAVTGVLADKTKKFEEIAKTFYAFAVVSGAAFAIASRYPDQPGWVGFTVAAFGFFGFGLYPICLELGVEVTYPVAEATSSAFIIMSGQVQSIIYLVVMQSLAYDVNSSIAPCKEPQDFTYANMFFVIMAFVWATLIIIAFRPTYRRMRAEQESAAQRILGFNSSTSPTSD